MHFSCGTLRSTSARWSVYCRRTVIYHTECRSPGARHSTKGSNGFVLWTVDRSSMTLERLSLIVGRTSILERPIVGRLSVNKSTDSRSRVGWESTDATYNTHDQADISIFRHWCSTENEWRALKESLLPCLHCAPLLLFTNGFFIVWCFASPSKGKTGLLSDRVIKRSNYWRELFVDNGLIFS